MELSPETLQELIQKAVTLASVHGLNILIAILTFIVGKYASRKVSNILEKILLKSHVDETLATFLKNITFYMLVAAVIIAALGQAGFNVTSFLAVLGAAGLAIGLALKDSLSNFAAGVMLIMLRFFNKGDLIEASGELGFVKTVNIFNTVLNTLDNKVVIIPNSAILGGNITNYTAEKTRRVDLVFGIGYGDDLLKAKTILERIVSENDMVLAEPAPMIEVSELGDSSVNFVCRPWVKTDDYWDVYFALTEKVKLTFDAEGISIPFPQRDVHIYNEEN